MVDAAPAVARLKFEVLSLLLDDLDVLAAAVDLGRARAACWHSRQAHSIGELMSAK